MRKIPIVEANIHQLRKYAETELGIFDFTDATTRAQMLAAIAVVDQSGMVTVDDFVAMEPYRPEIGGKRPHLAFFNKNWKDRMVARGEAYNLDPSVILQINKEEKPGGDEPVPIAVNGKAMYIERAKVCEIPYRYYLALTYAVRTIWKQTKDDGTREASESPAYPYNVLHLPTPGEIADWNLNVNGIAKIEDAEAA